MRRVEWWLTLLNVGERAFSIGGGGFFLVFVRAGFYFAANLNAKRALVCGAGDEPVGFGAAFLSLLLDCDV